MIKLAMVQFSPIHKNIIPNYNFTKQQIKKTNADIIIFPEMSLSGYFFTDRETLRIYTKTFEDFAEGELQELATKLNKVIIFGFAEQDDKNGIQKIYNSAILISPQKEETFVYRKSHLFYKENDVFDKSDLTSIYKFASSEVKQEYENKRIQFNSNFIPMYLKHLDLNIGILICYDWRFPELARKYATSGADLLVYPSNLVTPYWLNAFPARAIDNKVFVAVSNRIGIEKSGEEEVKFNGRTCFFNTNGEILTKFSESEFESQIIEFNHLESRNKRINEKNDVFVDLRNDLL